MSLIRKPNRLLIRTTLLLVHLALISCAPGMSEQQMLQNAKSYLDKGDLRAASIELRNTLQENAENAEARFLLGSINMQIGDLASAEKEFRRAANAGWNEEEVKIKIAQTLLAQREFEKLLDEIKPGKAWSPTARANLLGLHALAKAIPGDISSAKTTLAEGENYQNDAFHVLKSTALFQLSNILTGDARDTLIRALEIYKDDPELLLLYASAELQQNDQTEAANTYRKVISQDPVKLITVNGRNARIGLARLQINDKNFEQAQNTLKPLYQRNENDPEANYLGGLLAFEQENYSLAEDHIRKILKLAPNNPLSQQLMGKIQFALGNYDQAAHYLSSYLNAAPEDLATSKLLAYVYITLHQPQLARSVLQSAVSKNPNDTGLLLMMSNLEFNQENREAGILALKKAVEADPGNTALRKQLVLAYITVGETIQALKEINLFRETSGNNDEADILIVTARLKAGQYEQAIDIAQKIHAIKPKDAAVLSLNGSAYAASGNLQKARQYFEQALQTDKDMLSASVGLAEIEHSQGNISNAVKLYENLVDSGKGGTMPMLALAKLSEQQGQIDEMISWLEKARESAPGEIKPRIYLTNYYLNSKQAEKADIVIKEAINISPENTEILFLQGRVLIAQKSYNEALPPLLKLVSKKPRSVNARALLGEAYTRLGIVRDAREHLEKALDIEPDFALVLGMLAEIELQDGQSEKSLSYARRLQNTQPDFYLGYKLEGDVWMSTRDFTKAKAAFTVAWNKQQTAALAISLFKASIQSGDIDTALQPVIRWLDDHPDDTSTRFFLAIAYQEGNRNDDAIREYNTVLLKEPDNAAILNNLAWLYFINGDSRALAFAERAYRSAQEDPGIQDTYGWILINQQQITKGLGLITQALQKLPDNREVRYHYAVALLKSGKRKEGSKILRDLLNEDKPFTGRNEAERLLIEHSTTK